jgi:hypothetical protein
MGSGQLGVPDTATRAKVRTRHLGTPSTEANWTNCAAGTGDNDTLGQYSLVLRDFCCQKILSASSRMDLLVYDISKDHYAVRDACSSGAFKNNMLDPNELSLKGVSQ